MADIQVVTPDFVNVHITKSDSDDAAPVERRFKKGITVLEFKTKLELVTGGSAATMKLKIYDKKNTYVCDIDNDEALLGSYPIDDGMRIHVVDKFALLNDFGSSDSAESLRSNTCQIEMLVDYMSIHTLFANGEYKGPLGREVQDEEWVRLQQLLQEYGPNKTVEQWRTTWRDLKKKAQADGACVNSARVATGNNTVIPSLSNTSRKILDIISTESAYGMAGQQETGLGEIVPQPPPPVRSPPPSTSSTATQQASARGQRARSLRNDFLVSDAETRSVLQDIKNSLLESNKINKRKMRRNHLHRFRLSEEEYEKKGDTLRSFLQRNRLGKYNEEEMTKLKEQQQQELEDEAKIAEAVLVGARCEVRVPQQPVRRATVRYNGPLDGAKGLWIGVQYDEPRGKNDGSVNDKRYFTCPPKYGGFVKPVYVTVGDFPEEEFELDDEI